MLKLKQLFMILSFALVLVMTGCATDEINSVQIDDNNGENIEEQSDVSKEAEAALKDEEESETVEEIDGEKSAKADKKSVDSKSEDKPTEGKAKTDSKEEKSQASTKKPTSKEGKTQTSTKTSTKKTNNKNTAVTPTTEKPKQEKPIKDNSKAEKPKENKPVVEKKDTVTISVTVPSGVDGTSYGPKAIEFNDGDSVFDLLNKTGLQINSSGRGTSVYVRGISGLKEFDEGPMSGWKYKVDGVFPGESAGSYKVIKDQHIEWVYTVDWSTE